MSHKPGPWKLHSYGDVRADNDQAQICDIRGSGCTDAEVTANALLITAAPDLLAACKLAMEACRKNLAIFQYKDEPALHAAFTACYEAIELTSAATTERKDNPE